MARGRAANGSGMQPRQRYAAAAAQGWLVGSQVLRRHRSGTWQAYSQES